MSILHADKVDFHAQSLVANRIISSGSYHPILGMDPPALAFFATRSLRDLAIDHHESNRLLGQVVGRLAAGRRDETQVTFAVISETVGQVLCFRRAGNAVHDLGPKLVADVLQLDGGASKAIELVMPAMTTRSSISVKAGRRFILPPMRSRGGSRPTLWRW